MIQSKALVFKEAPEALPEEGKHLDIQIEEFDPDAEPPQGGFTAQVLHASLDPYLRHCMVPADAARDGFPPMTPGSVITNSCVARVLKSGTQNIVCGDVVIGIAPIQEYIAVTAQEAGEFEKLDNPYGLDLKLFLGPVGFPGLTAYSALYEVAKPKAGQTIFISAALGAVGQVVGQIAKIEKMRVIGSAGSDEKLKILTDQIGFDGGFNYRRGNITEQLGKIAPEGIDIYFDNVGGEQLDSAIERMNDFGTIAQCGYSSQYSVPHDQRYGLVNYPQIISKRISWRGLLVIDQNMGNKYKHEHRQRMSKWLADGTFTPIMHDINGMDNSVQGLIDLFNGKNVGKAVVNLI
ncbi:NAD(P)-binding protein [Penicillium brevicompactum]|uniref:NAD(P)-binding protein n=1 Tax=Penicillium brevicompactum TaxID=5074 RepID=A0A9W9RN00_PENBR|nr:NAD(P)-binding protein [Penicillium brevicompactum]